jgi:3',5'-cyclic AMP phosphodiesterase CpdA
MSFFRRWICVSVLALAGACTTPSANLRIFESGVSSGPRPWTNERFDDAPEQFSFAVVADLESGYRPGVFEVAAAELALLHPAFVLTIGDMIDGGSEDEAELRREWTEFDARLSAIPAPFFHVGGNHDLTNLVQRRIWEERYGPRYYHFLYRGVLFLVLDTEDYSAVEMKEIYDQRAAYIEARRNDPATAQTLPYASRLEARLGEIGPEQSAYFEKAIADHPEARWTFVMFHKPVYQREDDGGLKRIEAALKGRPYTVLNGHLHRYNHAEREGRDYIMLGTTGGERGFDGSKGAVDHFMWVTMTKQGPSIANIRLDGIFGKSGEIPAGGASLCLDHGAPPCPPSR